MKIFRKSFFLTTGFCPKTAPLRLGRKPYKNTVFYGFLFFKTLLKPYENFQKITKKKYFFSENFHKVLVRFWKKKWLFFFKTLLKPYENFQKMTKKKYVFLKNFHNVSVRFWNFDQNLFKNFENVICGTIKKKSWKHTN